MIGVLGLSYSVVGAVAQMMGLAAVERGNVSREAVVAYLTSDAFDEDTLWSVLGPEIDRIEDAAKEVHP